MSAQDDNPVSPELEGRLERCRRVLEELTEAGMALARRLDDPALPIETAVLAFSRLSRAVRLNLLLDLRLDELARGGLAAISAERALAQAAPEADAAGSPDPGERPQDAERAETRDRPDREAPDEALRLIRRPLPEVVAAVWQGLRLSPEDTQAAQAPFAALVANDDGPSTPPACRTAGVPPAAPSRPRNGLKARLLGGTSGAARALGP